MKALNESLHIMVAQNAERSSWKQGQEGKKKIILWIFLEHMKWRKLKEKESARMDEELERVISNKEDNK